MNESKVTLDEEGKLRLAAKKDVEENTLNLSNANKIIYIEAFISGAQSKAAQEFWNIETLKKAAAIAAELAAWSRKYPRGKIYPMSKQVMDDELVALEERAKEIFDNKP